MTKTYSLSPKNYILEYAQGSLGCRYSFTVRMTYLTTVDVHKLDGLLF